MFGVCELYSPVGRQKPWKKVPEAAENPCELVGGKGFDRVLCFLYIVSQFGIDHVTKRTKIYCWSILHRCWIASILLHNHQGLCRFGSKAGPRHIDMADGQVHLHCEPQQQGGTGSQGGLPLV